MHYTSTLLSLLSLLTLTLTSPTPIDLAPRCGTTVFPTFLQQLTESSPSTVNPNTLSANGDFHVSQTRSSSGQLQNLIYQVVGFIGIPSGSYGCQLSVTFPANYPITTSSTSGTGSNPLVNVYTLFNGNSAAIKFPNDYSWNKFAPFGQPTVGSLFGSVRFVPGTTQGINGESCPAGGGNLAFLFEIAADTEKGTGTSSVEFNEYINKLNGQGLAGVYLTYNC